MKHINLRLTILIFILSFTTQAYAQYKIEQNRPTLFMKDGGWCWYEDPRAIIHNGKLIIGVISGQSGDIRVGVYDLKSNTLEGVAILDENFEIDDHNSPVFHARPDGSLVAVWAEHGHEPYHYYSISDPKNYLKWTERKVFDHGFKIPENQRWLGVTYMNLYTIEKQQTLYNFFRNGQNSNPTFITSKDNGMTWENPTHFIKDEVEGKQRPYVRYMQKNKNMVGVSFTDGHPRVYGNSIYYVDFDGEHYYKADGTKIKHISEGPLKTSETDKIYTGSETKNKPKDYGSVPNAAWTCDLEKDKKNNPYIGYTLYLNPNDIRFRLANWTGKKWIDREIAHAGKGLYKIEDSYSGLMALDPQNPSNIVIASPVNPNTGKSNNGTHEIYMTKIKNKDTTNTIKWKQLTFNSPHKNIRPIIITGEGYKVLLWLNGPWEHFQSYESDIVGHILERPNR